MNIVVIGSTGKYSMETSISNAFNRMGHASNVCDIYYHLPKNRKINSYIRTIDQFVRKGWESFDKKSYERFAEKIKQLNPDLIVCVSRSIHPIFVSKLKNKNRKIIHINPDSLFTLGAQNVFASEYDVWFVKDPYMLNFMKNNMKLNTFLYNEVTDIHLSPKPNEAKHITEERIDVDVMTYGTLYPYRNRILKHLLDSGIKISLYGTKPHRFIDEDIRKIYTGEFILGERRAEVIYGSKIALNTLHFAEIDGVNARFFQINGCGGFQLCDYRPILKELLPVDPELVSYRNTDECIEKVQYYLNHPQERYDIADKIYQHSIKHFTFDNLVSYILSVVETL